MIKLTPLRILFATAATLLSIAIFSGYLFEDRSIGILAGLGAGLVFSAFTFAIDLFTKQVQLRTLNILILGLFFGYLLGRAVMLIAGSVLTPELMGEIPFLFTQTGIYLIAAYIASSLIVNSVDELHLSIPFIRFNPVQQKKKDILIDLSILSDCRIIDLAASGILDSHLVLPRFFLKELHSMVESDDDAVRNRARRCLDVVKKLEGIPNLDLRYADTEFLDIKDPLAKLVRVARLMDAHIITGDMSRIQQSTIEGVRVININALSNALKPLTQNGEFLHIKIQRYGKEARQGVGYLDDGTMVVVNGGAEFIGESIKAQVLSVKHTSSGRMIFCNALEDHLGNHLVPEMEEDPLYKQTTPKKYVVV